MSRELPALHRDRPGDLLQQAAAQTQAGAGNGNRGQNTAGVSGFLREDYIVCYSIFLLSEKYIPPSHIIKFSRYIFKQISK